MKVQCSNCGKKYQFEPNERPSDFQCDCGGELKIVNEPSNASDDFSEPLKPPKHPKYANNIFDDWKKQYLIVIAVVFLVFGLIAADSFNLLGDPVLTNLTVPANVLSGEEIIIPNTIENQGILPTNDFNVTFQFAPEKSPNNITFLGKIRMSDIAGGEVRDQKTKFTVPTNIKPSRYFIRVVVDSDNELFESNEDNDFYSSKQVYII